MIKKEGNGLYVFVLSGEFEVDGQVVQTRDGLGIRQASDVSFKALSPSAEVLLMEVPMQI